MGENLLYTEDVAELAGVKPSTIRTANAFANRQRRQGTATVFHLPAPARHVQRRITKSNGRPLVVWTPVWREADIRRWLRQKRGPGGRVTVRDA